MSNPIRWVVSSVVMAVAVVLTLAATLGGFAHHLATNPDPAREILGPLPADPVVSELLPKQVGQQVTERIPETLPLPNALKRILSDGIAAASGAVLGDPGFQQAWLQTIDQTRAAYVSELDAVNAGRATEATLKLEIGPLVDSTYSVLLQSLDGSALGALLPAAGSGPQVSIDTGVPAEDSIPATTIASWLALAGKWIWFAVGAVIVAVGALALARRANRGLLLASGGALVLIAGAALALWTGSWGNADAGAQDLQGAVTRVVLEGLGGQAMTLARGLGIGGGMAIVAGLGWFLLARRGASAATT